MKKSILILLLAMTVLTAGCVSRQAENSGLPAVEQTEPEIVVPEQPDPPAEETDSGLDAYMETVRKEAEQLREALEKEPLTQTELNQKSQELTELWDAALYEVLEALRTSLPEEEFAKLQEEQALWSAEKDAALEEAGESVKGGSLYALVMNMEAASLTEARVQALYDGLLTAGK